MTSVLFVVKVLVSALVIAAATEVAKRHPFWGALIVALPLTSLLAMSWLYAETRDNALLTQFAKDIFVLVPVSLDAKDGGGRATPGAVAEVFFLPFWLEKKTQFGFLANLLLGLGLLAAAVLALRRFLP